MSWTQRGLLIAVAGLGAVIVMSKVGGSSKGGLSPSKSPMKGAIYAAAVPVYQGAKLRDVMGGNYYDEIGGEAKFQSTSWFFEFKDPMAKVADFYSKNMPAGARPAEVPEGEIGYQWTPPGATEGEKVHVTIREGELQIGETIKAGKPSAAMALVSR
jgi:hypothetical protein